MRTYGRSIRIMAAAVLLLASIPAGADQSPDADPIARWLNRHSGDVMQGTLGLMLLVGDYETQDAATLTLDGSIGALGLSEALKLATRQPRPRDPRATDGFPSSHAATAFAVATGLSEWRSSWTVYAYSFAAGVGWARVEEGYHTLKQVLAGAAIGVWIAGVSHNSDGIFIHAGDGIDPALLPSSAAPEIPVRFGGGASVVLWQGKW